MSRFLNSPLGFLANKPCFWTHMKHYYHRFIITIKLCATKLLLLWGLSRIGKQSKMLLRCDEQYNSISIILLFKKTSSLDTIVTIHFVVHFFYSIEVPRSEKSLAIVHHTITMVYTALRSSRGLILFVIFFFAKNVITHVKRRIAPQPISQTESSPWQSDVWMFRIQYDGMEGWYHCFLV